MERGFSVCNFFFFYHRYFVDQVELESLCVYNMCMASLVKGAGQKWNYIEYTVKYIYANRQQSLCGT